MSLPLVSGSCGCPHVPSTLPARRIYVAFQRPLQAAMLLYNFRSAFNQLVLKREAFDCIQFRIAVFFSSPMLRLSQVLHRAPDGSIILQENAHFVFGGDVLRRTSRTCRGCRDPAQSRMTCAGIGRDWDSSISKDRTSSARSQTTGPVPSTRLT